MVIFITIIIFFALAVVFNFFGLTLNPKNWNKKGFLL